MIKLANLPVMTNGRPDDYWCFRPALSVCQAQVGRLGQALLGKTQGQSLLRREANHCLETRGQAQSHTWIQEGKEGRFCLSRLQNWSRYRVPCGRHIIESPTDTELQHRPVIRENCLMKVVETFITVQDSRSIDCPDPGEILSTRLLEEDITMITFPTCSGTLSIICTHYCIITLSKFLQINTSENVKQVSTPP